MLKRSRLLSLAQKAKRTRLLDLPLRYNPLARSAVLRRIRQVEDGGIATRREVSDALTRRILAAARKTRYGAPFGPEIADWPILRKDEVRADPSRFTTRTLLGLPASTGGTTGQPLKLVRSFTCVAAEQAFLDHLIRAGGLTWSGARIASLRGEAVKPPDDWLPPFAEELQGGRRLALSAAHLNAETIGWYHQRLRDYRPDLLWAYPTFAATLMSLLQQQGLELSIPMVVCSSETLSGTAMAALAAAFGGRVVDYYGQAERVCLSVAAAPEQHYFQPAYGRVELLPEPADEVLGEWQAVRIVATGFWNAAMPLIRYDTGDRALVPRSASAEDLDAIALGLRPFHGIAGRSGEFLYAPAGGRLAALNHIPRDVEHLLQLQIVQEALDRVTVRALVEPGFGPADRAKLTANARAKLPSPIVLTVEVVERLECLPNGKTPYVIRRIDPA